MKDIAFGVFRVEKRYRGRGSGSVTRSWRHLENHFESAEITHPERAKYNRTIISPSIQKKGITEHLKGILRRHREVTGKELRKDACVCVEMLYSFSPREFDINFVKEFESCVYDFIRKEFPQFKVFRLDLHCTEKTPHIHIIGSFIDERGRICNTKGLGSPYRMRELQTSFGEFVKPLGLHRGLPKISTEKEHTTKKEWLREKEYQLEQERLEKITLESNKALKEIFDDLEL